MASAKRAVSHFEIGSDKGIYQQQGIAVSVVLLGTPESIHSLIGILGDSLHV